MAGCCGYSLPFGQKRKTGFDAVRTPREVKSDGVKRALLVGVNYVNAKVEEGDPDPRLKGCVNDVTAWKDVLENVYGFNPVHIEVMVDTDPDGMRPTGKNIKRALRRLVAESRAGDVLFFHFSGHGTQLKDDEADEEADGKDEALVPCDGNVIRDDDIRAILGPLDPGCKFTFTADCCHSGSMLDHELVAISGSKDDPNVKYIQVERRDRFFEFVPMFMMLVVPLAQPLVGLAADKFREYVSDAFGEDAGQLICKIARAAMGKYTPGAAKLLPPPAKPAAKSPPPAKGDAKSPASAKEAAKPTTPVKEAAKPEVLPKTKSTARAVEGAQSDVGQPSKKKVHPQKKGKDPNPNKGILVTACQAHEKAADATEGDYHFGVFTRNLTKVIKDHQIIYPGQHITYRQATVATRLALKGRYPQNPCLECSDANADSRFILH